MSACSIVLGILPPHFPPVSQQEQRWSTTAGRSTEGWPTPARRADQCLFTDTTTRTHLRLDTHRSRLFFTAVLGLCSALLGRQSFCLTPNEMYLPPLMIKQDICKYSFSFYSIHRFAFIRQSCYCCRDLSEMEVRFSEWF